jgi:hypothetical protein
METIMKIENSVNPYLDGVKFHNGLPVKIASRQKLFSRIEFLTGYAAGKKIIHMGCADHVPIIKEKIEKGTWLHERLTKVAQKVEGVDVDADAIDYIKSNFNVHNIRCLDLVNDPVPADLAQESWDGMIMGELLEHIDNPVSFLKAVNEKYRSCVDELVLTIPNALSLSNFYQATIKNVERINTDHRYWFTPYTIYKILGRAGYKPVNHEFASYYSLNPEKKVRNYFLKKVLENRPALRGNLIVVAKFK